MPTLEWLNKKEALKTAGKVPYRLLKPIKDLSYGEQSLGNMLIKGDNLDTLKALLPYYKGQVKCIYIDPPYNTGSAFENYDDNLEHSIWLTMMYPRLEILWEMLSANGFIFIQIDDNENAYLKVICDEIFGRNSFVNNISVNMSNMSGPKVQHAINGVRFPKIKESILIYRKSAAAILSIPKILKGKWDNEYNIIINELSISDHRKIQDLIKSRNLDELNSLIAKYKISSRKEAEEKLPANKTDKWRNENAFKIFASKPNKALSTIAFQKSFSQQLMFIQNPSGDIKLIRTDFNKETPTQRIELVSASDHMETFIGDTWEDIVTTGGTALEGDVDFKRSKKPEKLICRVISSSTNPGDLVLDSFLGSGTTAAVAQKMGRRYIGIEMGEHAVTHCVPRLKKVIDGTDKSGISEAQNWQGGGGYTFYELGPEIFDAQGNINRDIDFRTLAFHVWFTETKTPMQRYSHSPLLGVWDDTAYYLLYNGILGDKSVSGGNVLTAKLLSKLPKHSGKKVIYGEACRLSLARLNAENIIFKQTPYDIKAR